jgi:prepilin-type N-terminal cleavage/methylation domain-containing protein
MMIKRQAGFTIIELMVTLVILGVLIATAVPLYHTWQQRAYGSEAMVMIKQILDAEIMYYLDNDKFFPETGTSIEVFHGFSRKHENVLEIAKALKITIPTGHFLDYILSSDNVDGVDTFEVEVSSLFLRFDIVKGSRIVRGSVDKNGNITYMRY